MKHGNEGDGRDRHHLKKAVHVLFQRGRLTLGDRNGVASDRQNNIHQEAALTSVICSGGGVLGAGEPKSFLASTRKPKYLARAVVANGIDFICSGPLSDSKIGTDDHRGLKPSAPRAG